MVLDLILFPDLALDVGLFSPPEDVLPLFEILALWVFSADFDLISVLTSTFSTDFNSSSFSASCSLSFFSTGHYDGSFKV